MRFRELEEGNEKRDWAPASSYHNSLLIRLVYTEFVKSGGDVYHPITQESHYKSAVEVFLEAEKKNLMKDYPALVYDDDFEDISDLADEVTEYAQAKLMENKNG